LSFAQFDDICEICFGMMEEEDELLERKKSNTEIIERKEGLTSNKKRIEAAREIVREKERQLIHK
jgi:hypothetical protein